MSGRGRRAVLPPAGFQATQRIAADGLQVTVVNKEGFERVFDFAAITVPQPMRCSLARAFAEQSMGWNSHASGESYWRSLEVFARFLKDQGHPAEDLGDLTSATLRLWRNNHKDSPGGREALAKMRTLLKREPQLAQGLAAEELARPVPKKGKPSKRSYRPSERDQVLLAAERQFRTALLRIRENTALLARYRAGALDPACRDWRIGAALEHIAATGELPGYPDKGGKVYTRAEGLLRGKNRGKTTGRLFLGRSELTALAVMMTDRYGWNLSVYDRLHVPVSTPSAGETDTVTYEVLVEKRRSGEGRWFDTENYTDSGADSPGRLITQALEATQHGRALAAALSPGHDLLMVARNRRRTDVDSNLDRPRNVGPLCFGVSKADARVWASAHKIGSPFQRARRTAVTATGKPLQHKRGTHESVYVLPDENVQKAAVGVIAAGAEEALEQARDYTFKGRLTDAADTAHQETATADCADEETSPWPDPSGGCGAHFLLCLSCENSRVHTGHHPRLALLRRQLISLRSSWPEKLWRKRWDEHLQRLDDLRTKVNESTWDAALARITDRDRMIVDHLLKGDLAP
ncbi:hypothetical protein SGM_5219 [Streptomyces griseoaurantiacus M045]|uniref:Uncharacterized protein n=1 Tax=Streptomyces griseoaurantiacus M045 TaxID=996637 RepID=F3NQE4_9ACTN|nr:hypothetical protein [Streptomyces griseoaurantiacus]EGG44404.1 hypothetical protein SGM_5219 [Streptomyces griseoaurantiacus M045]